MPMTETVLDMLVAETVDRVRPNVHTITDRRGHLHLKLQQHSSQGLAHIIYDTPLQEQQ